MKHKFWGEIAPDWAGFSSNIYFSHPFFGDKKVEVFLGEESDPDETDILPDTAQLNEFAATYQDFTANVAARLAEVQQRAFDYYRKYYAKFYEDTAQSGEAPLGIDTVEKHNPYLKNIGYLRLDLGSTLRMSIHYDLDTEHGLEFKFVNGQLANIGGIADT